MKWISEILTDPDMFPGIAIAVIVLFGWALARFGMRGTPEHRSRRFEERRERNERKAKRRRDYHDRLGVL